MARIHYLEDVLDAIRDNDWVSLEQLLFILRRKLKERREILRPFGWRPSWFARTFPSVAAWFEEDVSLARIYNAILKIQSCHPTLIYERTRELAADEMPNREYRRVVEYILSGHLT